MAIPRFGAIVATTAAILGLLLSPTVASAETSTLPTRLVSLTAAGAPADQPSGQAAVSADGRYVAFASRATNLTSTPSGTWNTRQIYRRDMTTGAVELVSTATGTSGSGGNSDSFAPSISADGNLVAFTSQASDIDAGSHSDSGQLQVYVRDMRAGGTIRMVSLNSGLSAGGNGTSYWPKISADGSTIAFISTARDLQTGVTPTSAQVYVATVAPSTASSTRVVSLQDGSRSPAPDLSNAQTRNPSISADGRLVSFMTSATNLVSTPVSGTFDHGYVHDATTGSTRLVTASPDWAKEANDASESLVLSADGTHIAFSSLATNLLVDRLSGNGGQKQVFVRDIASASPNILVSTRGDTGMPAYREGLSPSISADGRRIAFVSVAANLSYANTHQAGQVFLRDTTLRTTTLISSRHADPMDGLRDNYAGDPALSADGLKIAFDSAAAGIVDAEVSVSQVYLANAPQSRIQRIGGQDRYAVSAAISADTFGPDAAVAYVAAGTNYPDALSGSVAAGLNGGPVLLVMKDSIPATVASELARLRPRKIVILGGLASVGTTVQNSLSAYSADISRIGGADRYVVSAAISAKTFPAPGSARVAYVASGENFPDALSGSARAGREGGPVLLVTKDGVPAGVRAELDRLKPGVIVVLGGENSVSAAVAESLKSIAPVSRIGGADRYVVSGAISEKSFDPPSGTVYIALGGNFPDALSGSAAAVAIGAPVLLVTTDTIPDTVRKAIQRLKPYRIVVLGGPNSVSPGVETQLATLLSP